MIGKVVDGYRVTEFIGSGGRGDVFRAQGVADGLVVAIKFMRQDLLANAAAKEQFHRGAQALAALDHPNICRFHADGEYEGRAYVRMSFVEGETLQARISRGRLPVEEALAIARDVAWGLSHAHKRKVIHRDIKPANLMFDKDGVVKIVDFDLAKPSDPAMSLAGDSRAGTYPYMAPEHFHGDCVDARADIFALGDVLHEMLVGTHPFHGEGKKPIVHRICYDFPKPLSEARPDADGDTQEILDRALQKDPRARYQSAEEMCQNLQAVIDGKGLAAQKRPRSKVRWAVATAAAAAAIALVIPPLIPDPVGLAVVGIDADGSAEHGVLTAGLAHDLTDRARALACDKKRLWIVTPDRLADIESRDPNDLKDLLGANLVITVRAVTDTDRPTFELQGFTVASPPELLQTLDVDFSQPLDKDGLDNSLKGLVGIKSGFASRGYTNDADAYRAYVVGLGCLDARPVALDRAIASFERATDADSLFARAWAALGDAYRLRYLATKDTTWLSRAESACRRALALVELCDAWVTVGQLQVARGRPGDAITSYQRALAVDRRNNVAWWKLADVHIAGGRKDDAVAAYESAVAANDTDPRPSEWLGFYLYQLERYDEAIAPLKRVSRLIPLYGPNYNMLAACYYARDCWKDATAMFEKSFDLERSYLACTNLGTLYYMNLQFEDATGMYEWALAYNPGDYSVVGALGAARYWIRGQSQRAEQSYREAARLAEEARRNDGESATLLAELSGYYAIIGHDSTIAVAERALHLAPDNADVLFRLAMTYEHMGMREKALAFLRSCVRKDYSLRHIESEPFLAELRKDPRYKKLIRSAEPKPGRCRK